MTAIAGAREMVRDRRFAPASSRPRTRALLRARESKWRTPSIYRKRVRDIVERYLNAIASHHWDVVDECIAADIVRVGPYGDRYAGRDEYLAFIADLMPRLEGYAMELHRVTYASDALAFVELSETVELDGKPMLTPEVLVFGLDGDGRIARVDVYIQTQAG